MQPSVQYHFQNHLEINTSLFILDYAIQFWMTFTMPFLIALTEVLCTKPCIFILYRKHMCYFTFMHSAVLCSGSVSINMKHIFYKLFDIQEKQMQIDGPHLHTRSKINYIYNYVWWLCAWAAWFSSILYILIVVMQQLSFIVSAVPVYLF